MSSTINSETELIQTYLAPLAANAAGAFGLLDDAALLTTAPGQDFVVTTDPVIAGVHFFSDDPPEDIAWKALAVNVSDLAAKGAAPVAYTLALAFPGPPDRRWMERFSNGLGTAQAAFGCQLIGGDTDRTPGPLSVGVTAFGSIPKGEIVKRQGAEPGDLIFLSGTLGDAALGLDLRRGGAPFAGSLSADDTAYLIGRYRRPQPRIALAPALRAHARAALDVSDGLAKDLARLMGTFGAEISFEHLPLSQAALRALAADESLCERIIGGGDDYEILCAVPPSNEARFFDDAERAGDFVSKIGVVSPASTVTIVGAGGGPIALSRSGYDHFAGGG